MAPLDDSWRREAARAITIISRMGSARPFLEPVSEEEVPDYPLIIKHPMDLGIVRSNIRAGVYPTPGHAWQDLQLVSCDWYAGQHICLQTCCQCKHVPWR